MRPFVRATLLAFLAASVSVSYSAAPAAVPGLTYSHDAVSKGPWSIHIAKMDRAAKNLELHSTLGRGTTLGVGTLADQMKTLPPEVGVPLAAVNGDYAKAGMQYQAHPVGLQVMRGELVSAPSSNACFWMEANGQPHGGEVRAQFSVTWPDNRTTALGVNDTRTGKAAMLYSSVFGKSTATPKGRELILERDGTKAWLPLTPGVTLTARVRDVREAGNTPLTPDTLVLSLDPRLLAGVPAVTTGAVLTISLATTPSLAGARTAVGGGPVLVLGGKAVDFRKGQDSYLERHPRTAVGWNDQHLFLVTVDGRQKRTSVGMTLPELAHYLINLGCREAVNLDGGGSTTFWHQGQVVNTPCEGRERPMVNALVIVQKPASAAKAANQ